MSAANGALLGGILLEKQKRRVPGVTSPGVVDGLVHGVSGEEAGGFKLVGGCAGWQTRRC